MYLIILLNSFLNSFISMFKSLFYLFFLNFFRLRTLHSAFLEQPSKTVIRPNEIRVTFGTGANPSAGIALRKP